MAVNQETRNLALAEGVAAGVLFGTAAIFIRFLRGMDACSTAFWRLAIACLVLAITFIAARKPFELNMVKKNLKELCILGLFLGFHFVLFSFSVKDTTILNATVLVNTAPVFSILMSRLLFKVKPSCFALVGLAISFIGICVIAYAETVKGQDAGQSYPSSIKGDVEALLGALLIAFYVNYGKKVRNRMNMFSIMPTIYLFGAFFVGVSSLLIGEKVFLLSFDVETVFPIIGLGVFPTAVAHTLYFSSLSNLKPFETATMALLEPVGATILSTGLLGEIPAPVFALGAALVLVGIIFILKYRSPSATGLLDKRRLKPLEDG